MTPILFALTFWGLIVVLATLITTLIWISEVKRQKAIYKASKRPGESYEIFCKRYFVRYF